MTAKYKYKYKYTYIQIIIDVNDLYNFVFFKIYGLKFMIEISIKNYKVLLSFFDEAIDFSYVN